jgi:hypothetical protein
MASILLSGLRHAASIILPVCLLALSSFSSGRQITSREQLISQTPEDADRDGLADAVEQELAEKYAPIIYHERNERNFPTNVGDFFQKTSLYFFDNGCPADANSKAAPGCAKPPSNLSGMSCLVENRPDLQSKESYRWRQYDPCGQKTYYADTCFDRDKELTFYLSDVAAKDRKGDPDTAVWITYYHAYINDRCAFTEGVERCGVTVQYWRFYAYNTGPIPGGLGSHGGDWEGVHIVLDEKLEPIEARLLGHRGISYYRRPRGQPWAENQRWGALRWEGARVKIKSENGGHASTPFTSDKEADYIRQETWAGGKVRWPLNQTHRPGQLTENSLTPLRNLGEKTAPMRGMAFIQYAGLWGSPGKSLPFVGPISSGYWGPAYNETGQRSDSFITAWCEGMKESKKQAASHQDCAIRECYPPKCH